MTLNQRSVNVYSTLYACWSLSLRLLGHLLLDDGADSKYSHLKVDTAKFDFEFDGTPLKCIGWLVWAMVLRNFSVGRPSNVDKSGAKAYFAFNRCECFDFLSLSPTISLCFLWETAG